MRHPILPVLLLSACGNKSGTCSDVAMDGATATVDGSAWTASEVTWLPAGDSVHVVSTSEGAGWFSIVAQTTPDGDSVATAVNDGAFPIDVTLKTGTDGGFATWYAADDSASATTEGGEGTLTLSGEDSASLSGCLAFTAGPDGADVDFEDGQFTAVAQP